MRLRRPIAFILSAVVAASALTGCDSFSGHAAAAANSAQVQQLIEFIADLGLERDLRQALQKGGDLRQALLTLLGLESAVNFNVDDLAGARPGQHAVQVWEVTAQSAEDAAALAASQIRAVLEQLKSSGVTEGRIGMVEVDGKYYVVVDVEVTEENTFEPAKPVSDDDDDSDDDGGEEEQQPQEAEATLDKDGKLTITGGSGTLNKETIEKLLSENPNWISTVTTLDLSQSGYTQIGNPGDRYGFGAFQGCDQLTKVTLPNTITEIGSYAFEYCTNLKEINLSGCTKLKSIGNGAFANSGLTEINLSNCISLESIGNNAFQNCTSLGTITLSSTVTTIGYSAFWGCFRLTEIDLSNTKVNTIGDSAFLGCTSLKTVTMGNVGSIGEFAFMQCTSLQTVTMGEVGSIGNGAFSYCTSLQTVTMGEVGSIGNGAFSYCTSLTNICFSNGSLPNVDEGAFEGAGSSSGVHIYSNIKDNDTASKTTVKGWFDQDVQAKVEFHPYSPGPQNIPALPSLL